MSTLETQLRETTAHSVSLDDKALKVCLTDGRVLVVPLIWFPRLSQGTPDERSNWRLMGSGEGIHWPDLDEDISVESLLAGRRSGETLESLRSWHDQKNTQWLPRERHPGLYGHELTAHSFQIAQEVSLALELSGVFALTGQQEGVQPNDVVPSPTGARTTAMPQPPLGSSLSPAFYDFVSFPVMSDINQLPCGVTSREKPSNLHPRGARRKRSGSARPVAA
jgi:hypothetical protein